MVSGIGSSNSLDLSTLSDAQSKILKKMDTDDDGKVSKEEFETAVKNSSSNNVQMGAPGGKPPAGPPPPGGPGGPPPSGGMPPGGAKGASKSKENSSTSSSSTTTSTGETDDNPLITTIEENIKKLLESFRSISNSSTETSSSIKDLLKNLEEYSKSKSDSTNSTDKTKLFENIRNDIISVLDKNGLYNQQGLKSFPEIQNILDITS